MQKLKRFSAVALLALCAFPWEQSTNAAAHVIEQSTRPRRIRRMAPQQHEVLQEVAQEALPDVVHEVVDDVQEVALAEHVELLAQLNDIAEPEMPNTPEVAREPHAAAMPADSGEGFSLARAFSTTTPAWLVLIFAFLWGILVSFTPCVYPMIPITAAVMQSQATTSALRNVVLASSYILGMATVYATLGYLAATTTLIFGQWAGNPWVIGFVVLFLLYLALAMFGYYDIYIPRFLTKRKGIEARGSLIWSFIAGAIAGTVSSPCLSPALFTVLLYVSTLGDPLMGFLTLFAFSLGMGVLLMIVGTSSAALSLLPRAGAWLYEVKNVFGFLLLLLSVYFISINPSLTFAGVTIPTGYPTTAALVGLIALLAGLYYLRAGRKCLLTKRPPRRVGEELGPKHTEYIMHCTGGYAKVIISTLLLGGAALMLVEAYLARCGMGFLNLW